MRFRRGLALLAAIILTLTSTVDTAMAAALNDAGTETAETLETAEDLGNAADENADQEDDQSVEVPAVPEEETVPESGQQDAEDPEEEIVPEEEIGPEDPAEEATEVSGDAELLTEEPVELSEEQELLTGSGMTLDANGGVFSDGKSTKKKSSTSYYLYDDDIPTKEGAAFIGWFAEATCETCLSDESYPRRLDHDAEEGATIYAGWTSDYWTVTYNLGDGYYRASDSKPKQTSVVCLIPKTHTLNTGYGYYYPNTNYIRSNDAHYKFENWTKTQGGSDYYYPSSQYQPLDSDLTLYAKYTTDRYIITYHANGETEYYRYTVYDDDGKSETKDLPTKTESVSHGSNSYATKNISDSKPYELYTSDPRKVFAGWYLNAACTEEPEWYSDYSCTTPWQEGDSYKYLKLSGDVDLYAKWVSTNKVLSFDPNGGVFCDSTTSYKQSASSKEFGYAVGETISYSSGSYQVNNPKHTDLHKKFTGWYATKACTGDPVFAPEYAYSSYSDLRDYTVNDDQTFYAGWTDAYQVVTFDMNGGILTQYQDPVSGQYVYDASVTTIAYPTDENKRIDDYPGESHVVMADGTKAFEGWYTAATGGEEIRSLYHYTVDRDTVIYAHWLPVYSVTFDANGGVIKTNKIYNSETGLYDYTPANRCIFKTGTGGKLVSYPGSDDVFWEDGSKVLTGWYDGDNKIENLYNYMPSGNVTLTARWISCYTVTFDANGGKIKTWNGETQSYDLIDTVERKTGGTGTVSNVVYESYVIAPEGMIFSGWYLAGDESMTHVNFSEWIPESNTVIKAHYIAQYTVTFDANGGTIRGNWNSDKQAYDYVTSVEKKTNSSGFITDRPSEYYITTPDETKVFAGWYLSTDDTKTLIDLDTFKPEGNVTLMALYRDILTITFDANGGKIRGDWNSDKHDYDYVTTKTMITGGLGTITNYYNVPGENYMVHDNAKRSFDGWYTAATGGDQITDFSSHVFTENTTLYAHWSTLLTVTFNADGGTIRYWENGEEKTTQTREYTTDKQGKLESYPNDNYVTKEGWIFAGWYINNTKIADLSTYVFTADCTVKAHWIKVCEVTFDGNGGTFKYIDPKTGNEKTGSKVTYKVNDQGKLDYNCRPQGDPVRSGQVFTGWYMNGILIESLWDFMPTADVTLIAKYIPQYSVTFDAGAGKFTYYDEKQGKTVEGTKVTYKTTMWGSTNYYPSNPVPNNANQVFDGWFIGDKRVKNISSYEPTSNVTIKAKYVSSHKVTFCSMGGFYRDREGEYYKEVYLNQELRVPAGKSLSEAVGTLNALEYKDGEKAFGGWYLSADYKDSEEIDEEGFVPTADTTLYAKWLDIHTVTFEAGAFNEIQGRIEGTTNHTIEYKVLHGEQLRYVDGAGIPDVDFGPGQSIFLNGWFDTALHEVSPTVLSDDYILSRPVVSYITYRAEITLGRYLIFRPNGGTFLSVEPNLGSAYCIRIPGQEEHLHTRGKEPMVVRNDDPQQPGEHWVFKGWFYDEECTKEANLSDLHKIGYDEIELYAGWDECYTVTFHTNKEGAKFANGSDTEVVKVVKGEPYRYGADGKKINTRSTAPELKVKPEDSFPLSGWYTNQACEGDKYVFNDDQYYVHEDENGGLQYHYYDAIYGRIITHDEDYYIKWLDGTVNLTFDANGGVFSSYNYWSSRGAVQSADHTQWTVPVPKGIPWSELDINRPYSFDSRPDGMYSVGWQYYDKACLNGVGGNDKINDDLTVYCKWYAKGEGTSPEPEAYKKVNYHAGEGYFLINKRHKKTQSASYKVDTRQWYASPVPLIDNDTKIFAGWYLDEALTKPYYEGHFRTLYVNGGYSHEIRFPQEVKDLYAAYTTCYQVELDANGGYFDNNYDRYKDPGEKMRRTKLLQEKVYPGQAVIISEYTKRIRRDGSQIFGGWYTDPACTSEATVYALDNDAELFKPTDNTTLYAKWIPYEKPASVTISIEEGEDDTIDIGDLVHLNATVTGENMSGRVHWFISEYSWDDNGLTQCAMLDNAGTVTGLAHGDCVVYADVNGISSNAITIHVTDKVVENNMTLNKSELALCSGEAAYVKATITPKGLASILAGNIQWSSDKPGVAGVEVTDGGAGAIITAGYNEGKAVITAKLGNIERKVTVHVTTAIDIDKDRIIITAKEGASAALKTVYFTDLDDTLQLEVLDREEKPYEGISAQRYGNASDKGEGKSEQEWVVTIDEDPELMGQSELTLRASVQRDGRVFKDECTLVLNPMQATDPVEISMAPGSVAKGTRVMLSTKTVDADIYYTEDETVPDIDAYKTAVAGGTTESCTTKLYCNAIVINQDVTITAVANKNGRRKSEPAAFAFTVDQWGDVEDSYREGFGAVSGVPEGIWYVVDGRVYRQDGETAYTAAYTGSALTPGDKIAVYSGTTKLVENRDYTISYLNNINAAQKDARSANGRKSLAPTITVTGKGNFGASAAFTFTIDAAQMDEAVLASEEIVTVASGKAVKLGNTKPTVSFAGKNLVLNKDYTLTYYKDEVKPENEIANPAKEVLNAAGMTYKIAITGKDGGNFTGSMTKPVTVRTVDAKDTKIVQVGKLKAGDSKGKALKFDFHENAADGMQDYYNADGTLDPEALFDNATDGNSSLAYVYVKSASSPLLYGRDYTVEVPEGDDAYSAGKHAFVIRGTSLDLTDAQNAEVPYSCIGTLKVPYEIAGVAMNTVKIAGLNTAVEYTGAPITLDDLFNPADQVAASQGWDTVTLYTAVTEKINKKKVTTYTVLQQGVDYELSMANTGVTGRFNLTITGLGKYTGTVTKPVSVKAYNLNDAAKDEPRISIAASGTAIYCKTGAVPESVTVHDGTKLLKPGIDYTLSYKNNTKLVDDYEKLKANVRPTVVVKGIGNYTGTNATAYFNITKAVLEDCVELSVNDVIYNAKGKAGYMLVAPNLTDNGKAVTTGKNKDADAIDLKKDVRYCYAEDTQLTTGMKYAGTEVSPTDPVPAGTLIKVTVRVNVSNLNSPYTYGEHSLSAYYKVIAADLAKATVSFAQGYEPEFFNGAPVIPLKSENLVVKIKTTILNPEDYEIVSITDNHFLGTATMVIRGRGSYGGIRKFTFTVSARSVKAPQVQ
ncbi:MAG: InlB B-repeat-containing protein [Lachnospiraceae bacterium]|nr:InlB B-repeat-containing protein [Lachnospiraceae bacterium]